MLRLLAPLQKPTWSEPAGANTFRYLLLHDPGLSDAVIQLTEAPSPYGTEVSWDEGNQRASDIVFAHLEAHVPSEVFRPQCIIREAETCRFSPGFLRPGDALHPFAYSTFATCGGLFGLTGAAGLLLIHLPLRRYHLHSNPSRLRLTLGVIPAILLTAALFFHTQMLYRSVGLNTGQNSSDIPDYILCSVLMAVATFSASPLFSRKTSFTSVIPTTAIPMISLYLFCTLLAAHYRCEITTIFRAL